LQHREGAGPLDFNTGRERVGAIAVAGREVTGETTPPVKLEAEGVRRRALSEKKREHGREAARERVPPAMRTGGDGSGEERTWFHIWRERVEASRSVGPILWNGMVLHL
jgi:hypothetical protein